ncbi:MAG: hypothetical protein LBV43_02835 [Prevotella sp.]|jgi:hypothetical protein|nr:hypothetical protein [Prevotella sp.]
MSISVNKNDIKIKSGKDGKFTFNAPPKSTLEFAFHESPDVLMTSTKKMDEKTTEININIVVTYEKGNDNDRKIGKIEYQIFSPHGEELRATTMYVDNKGKRTYTANYKKK